MSEVKTRIGSVCAIVFTVFALIFIAGGAYADSVTIVSVDTNRILESHPAFLQAQAEYQAEMQNAQQQISGMEEDEKMVAQHQLQQQMQELAGRLQAEATASMQQDIEKIAREKGYDYVLDSSVLLSGGKNVTEEILKELK